MINPLKKRSASLAAEAPEFQTKDLSRPLHHGHDQSARSPERWLYPERHRNQALNGGSRGSSEDRSSHRLQAEDAFSVTEGGVGLELRAARRDGFASVIVKVMAR
jgi:hypothetical protein